MIGRVSDPGSLCGLPIRLEGLEGYALYISRAVLYLSTRADLPGVRCSQLRTPGTGLAPF